MQSSFLFFPYRLSFSKIGIIDEENRITKMVNIFSFETLYDGQITLFQVRWFQIAIHHQQIAKEFSTKQKKIIK